MTPQETVERRIDVLKATREVQRNVTWISTAALVCVLDFAIREMEDTLAEMKHEAEYCTRETRLEDVLQRLPDGRLCKETLPSGTAIYCYRTEDEFKIGNSKRCTNVTNYGFSEIATEAAIYCDEHFKNSSNV